MELGGGGVSTLRDCVPNDVSRGGGKKKGEAALNPWAKNPCVFAGKDNRIYVLRVRRLTTGEVYSSMCAPVATRGKGRFTRFHRVKVKLNNPRGGKRERGKEKREGGNKS